MPIHNDEGCSPSAVICRAGLQPYVREMTKYGRQIHHKDDLPGEVTSHKNWSMVEQLSPRGEDIYRCLGGALKGIPAFAVGCRDMAEDTVKKFINIFVFAFKVFVNFVFKINFR